MAIKEVKISLDLNRVFIDESKREKMFKNQQISEELYSHSIVPGGLEV
jgi:hypothetical protein